MKSRSAIPLIATLIILAMLLAWLGWSPPARTDAPPPAGAGKQADTQPRPAPKNLKATAAQALADGRFKNFDKRVDGKPIRALNERQRLAMEALRKEVPDVQVDFDPLTGSPQYVVSTTRFLTQSQTGLLRRSLSYDEAMAKVKSFVDAHRLLFGHGSAEVDAAQVTRKDTTERSGLQTVVWEQRAMGVPVFQSLFKANLSAQGEIAAVASELIADSKAAATNYLRDRPADFIASPSVSAEQAVSLAAGNVGNVVAAGDVQKAPSPNPKLALDFFTAPGLSDAFARKVWLPMDAASVRLAWEVNLTSPAANESFTIVIDALSGEALVRQSRTAADTTPQYTVWTGESPTPLSPRPGTASNTQPQLAARTIVAIQSLNATASPNGWINDGVNTTTGNNVDAYTDTDSDDVADSGSRPTGSPNRVFNFPVVVTQEPGTYSPAAVTQLFYSCNWIHDQLYSLGFTETAGNFQTSNFERNGSTASDSGDNDAVNAEAQDAIGIAATNENRNNANFSTQADGVPPRMQMYVWPNPVPDRDGCFDTQIVIHEYVHGLSNRLVGGGALISNLQTAGMGEGWSDFYALALLGKATDDPYAHYVMAAYSTFQFPYFAQNPTTKNYDVPASLGPNYFWGLRAYPYSTSTAVNPLRFKDIDPNQSSQYASTPRNPRIGAFRSTLGVHSIGEVWCTMLFEARAAFIGRYGFTAGNQEILQLVTDGMKLAPANPTFIQSRNAIIAADQVKNSGANFALLWNAFAKRGLGNTASSPISSTTVGVVEATDVPAGVDTTAPQPVFAPLTINQAIYQFNTVGGERVAGTVNEDSAVTLRIIEKNVTGNDRYWNGSTWLTDAGNMTTWLPMTLTGSNWEPAAGVVLPLRADTRAGLYSITVRAVNNAGLVGESSINVNRTPESESVPPVVQITAPGHNSTVGGLFTIDGTASDNVGGSGLTGAVTLTIISPLGEYWNGSGWSATSTSVGATVASNGQWHYTALPSTGVNFRTGVWIINAAAFDWAGNASVPQPGVTSVQVTVNLSSDATPPTLQITSPFPSGTSLNAVTQISGTSGDTGGSGLTKYVTLTLYQDGDYWNGTAWTSTQYELTAPVADDGSWIFEQMPTGANARPGQYSVSAASHDYAGNSSQPQTGVTNLFFNVDASPPTGSITSPANGGSFLTFPAFTGTANDSGGISSVVLYLRRNSDWRYWDGANWVLDAYRAALSSTYNPGDHTFTGNFTLPTIGQDTAGGSFNYIALPVDAAGNHSQYDAQVSVSPNPPRVAVVSPAHGSLAKAGWSIAGTATDTAGGGFGDGNRVTFSLNHEGQFWNGTAWTNTPTTLYADILPNNTWTYPGTTPGATLPPDDGVYAVGAHVRDISGNVSEIVAGGLPGNNQVIFTVDATPPLLTLASPAPGTTIDSSPLPAGWIHGTAFDSAGAVTVTFRLKRLPSVVFTDYFWNGESWKDEFGTGIVLNGTFPADNGPTSWKFTGHQPRPGWDFNHCLVNGAYEIVAVARDLAGNETTLTRPFSVNYNPQYIPPAFENMPTQPLQTPVFPTSALGGNNASNINPLMPVDDRYAFAQKLVKSPTGPYYVASQLNPPEFSTSLAAVVLQRLGSSAWRIENSSYSTIDALDTDSAGNVYALYRYKISAQSVLVKYTPTGSIVWQREFPESLPDYAYIDTPVLKRMAWLPDGALGLLFSVHVSYGTTNTHSTNTAVAVVETDGDVRYRTLFGMVDYRVNDPAHFESTPVDFAGDAAGNVFVASIETERFTGYGEQQPPDARRIIRKLSPTGAILGTPHITITCDFPEHWDRLATDQAGNVYVAGRFMGGIRSENDHSRQEMIKFDNNLAFQWRAFGPPRTPEAGDMVTSIDAGADGVMTIDNSGMAAFFTSAGALKWARPIIAGGYNSYLFTFAGGSAVGILHTGSVSITQHLVKISRAGDTQFDLPFDTNYDQIIDLRADTSDIFLLRQAYGIAALPYLDTYYNIPDATIPVTLDPVQPRDQVLIAGDELRLPVINSGTLATAHQWRKYDAGTPVNIPGANSAIYVIPTLVMGDAGQFDCVVTNPNNNATSRTATLSVLAPAAFDVALDTPGRTWTTGGNAPFVGFMAQNPAGPAHDNTDAIMNRPLGVNQSAFIETTVTGPGSVTFWWKSANDEFPDDFTFSIDGDDLAEISGVQDWTPVSRNFGPGTHTLRWEYYKFSNSTATNDRVWLDDITITGSTAVSLADALDTTGLDWRTSAGGLAWTGGTSPSHDGVDSAASGTTGNNQQSYVEVDVIGPGTLTFWWKVSCEPNWDRLAFTIEESPSGSITGEQDWVQATRTIPAGQQTLRWSYNKDEIGFGGLDKAWLDQVVFTPGGGSGPDIAVESPVNHALIDNAGLGVDFGTALPGNNTVRTFTIRNTGNAPLENLVISKSGGPSADLFTIGSLSTTDPVQPGGTATFNVTFAPVAEGSRGAALHITSNDPDESPFDIGIYGTGGVPITSWRQTHFGTTANTGNAADDADADNDGVPNLLEFATQGTPGTSDKEPGELAPLDGSGSIYFTYTRNKQVMAEITFQVEWADDLSGPWSPSGVVENILSDNGLVQTVTATLPAGSSGHRFVRLRVSR